MRATCLGTAVLFLVVGLAAMVGPAPSPTPLSIFTMASKSR